MRAQGFQIDPGHAAVSVQVLRFYNDFKIGFFSGDAIADVELNVTVRDPANSIMYTQTYSGTGKEADILLATGSNARAALIRAFQNAVNGAVSDKSLHSAIVAAQQPRPAGAIASPSS